jgi:hypothetical protein
MRLTLGLFFLFLGTAIFVCLAFFPEVAALNDRTRSYLGGIFALVFGGLNLARWYAARSVIEASRTPVRYPLQRDPSAVPQDEPNPEFDFTSQKPTQSEGENVKT